MEKMLYICSMTSKNNILSTIRTHKPQLLTFGINKIGLFGSYVRNEQKPTSDIDILVDFEPEKATLHNLTSLYDYLNTLFAGEKVEVVTVDGLSPYIGRYILNEVSYV